MYERSLKTVSEVSMMSDTMPTAVPGSFGSPVHPSLSMPKISHQDTIVAAVPRRIYSNGKRRAKYHECMKKQPTLKILLDFKLMPTISTRSPSILTVRLISLLTTFESTCGIWISLTKASVSFYAMRFQGTCHVMICV